METEEDRQRVNIMKSFKQDYFGFEEIDQEKLDEVANSHQTSDEVRDVYKNVLSIIPSIRNLGFNVDIVPLPLSHDGFYWVDYADTYLDDKYKHSFFDKDFLYFTIYLDETGNINMRKDIIIHFSELTKEMKESLLGLFYEHLLDHFSWNGNNNKTMILSYKKIENPVKLNFDSLNSEDRYPLLLVFITFETINGYDLFTYLEKDNIISEIQHILEKDKITCSWGFCDIEITCSCVDIKNVNKIYKALTSILGKVKRKRKKDFGVSKCKFYYYESASCDDIQDKCKKYKLNCDPIMKDRLFDFEKYLK